MWELELFITQTHHLYLRASDGISRKGQFQPDEFNQLYLCCNLSHRKEQVRLVYIISKERPPRYVRGWHAFCLLQSAVTTHRTDLLTTVVTIPPTVCMGITKVCVTDNSDASLE